MKKFIIAALLLAGCTVASSAQELTVTEKPKAETETATPWYITLDYAGYEFEIPAGSIVEKNSSLLVKYPDGTFGVSMMNEAKQGSNQKLAFTACQKLAAAMKIPNAKVQKVKFGKCGGAMASGEMEGQKVTVLVLPYNNQEVSTVILATPNRTEWVNHFLETLKR